MIKMPEISRVARSKEEAKTSYNRMSRWYDALAGDSEKKYRDIGLQFLGVQPGETVLEIGFGTGQAILSLRRSVGGTGKVYGLDISESMLAITKARLHKACLMTDVELECGDAARLTFPDEMFNAIFMCFTLELFNTPEIPIVLKECLRVLRRDGRICVVAMSKKGKTNLMTGLYGWAHKTIPAYVDCRPIYAQEAIETAGFKKTKSNILPMWGLPVEIVLAVK